MDGRLYLLFVTVLLLFALAITLPVIRDIVREGLDRRHQRKVENRESDTDAGRVVTPGDEHNVVPGGHRCSHCGARNDAEYVYCQECAKRL